MAGAQSPREGGWPEMRTGLWPQWTLVGQWWGLALMGRDGWVTERSEGHSGGREEPWAFAHSSRTRKGANVQEVAAPDECWWRSGGGWAESIHVKEE